MKDWWNEKVELVKAEFHWTINYFQFKADAWDRMHIASSVQGKLGPACKAARQNAVYLLLQDQCQTKQGNMFQRAMQKEADSNSIS